MIASDAGAPFRSVAETETLIDTAEQAHRIRSLRGQFGQVLDIVTTNSGRRKGDTDGCPQPGLACSARQGANTDIERAGGFCSRDSKQGRACCGRHLTLRTISRQST